MSMLVNEPDTNYQPVELNSFQGDAVKGNFSKNCLNDLFFSDDNINALQLGMKNMVANETEGEHIIGKQDETQLRIIMRSIYYQYGLNLDTGILKQVRDLNKKVLDYAVNRILNEIEQYKMYIRDASQMAVPLARSQYESSKGTKVLHRAKLF